MVEQKYRKKTRMAAGLPAKRILQLSRKIIYEYCGQTKIVVHNAKNSVKYQVLGG